MHKDAAQRCVRLGPVGQSLKLLRVIGHGLHAGRCRGVRPVAAPDHAIGIGVDEGASQVVKRGVLHRALFTDEIAARQLHPGAARAQPLQNQGVGWMRASLVRRNARHVVKDERGRQARQHIADLHQLVRRHQ
ncbi:hypothetical protein D3C77_580980 [compost metagenome]